MLFLGDISVPTEEFALKLKTLFEENNSIFEKGNVVFNLEGLLSDDLSNLEKNTSVVFNHPRVLDAFQSNKKLTVLLANNHTLDLPENFENTRKKLEERKINFTGAGKSKKEAEEAVFLEEDGVQIIILNYCWDFLLYHQKNPSLGIWASVYDEREIEKRVEKYRSEYPESRIMIYFHWSFDMETLPFPAYRTLAMALIDKGADLIVGCHSHCVQGGEVYNGKSIVYGLGNFYFPNGVYISGKLKFPDWANETLVLDWNPKTNKVQNHWFRIEGEKENYTVSYDSSEPFDNGNKIKEYSPFREKNHDEYVSYYRTNRRKKQLIPVFKNHRDYFGNDLKKRFLKLRARTARNLAKLGLIKWQS